jgi:hypothetical protein
MLHFLVTFVLVGSMSHHLFCLVGYMRGRFTLIQREKKMLSILFWSYLVIYIFGCLIYPAFRIYMRYEYFDTTLPWATGLFEVKEHWASHGLAILAFCYILRKNFDPAEDKQKLWLYIPLCIIVNVIVWYNIITGVYLTHLKGAF